MVCQYNLTLDKAFEWPDDMLTRMFYFIPPKSDEIWRIGANYLVRNRADLLRWWCLHGPGRYTLMTDKERLLLDCGLTFDEVIKKAMEDKYELVLELDDMIAHKASKWNVYDYATERFDNRMISAVIAYCRKKFGLRIKAYDWI